MSFNSVSLAGNATRDAEVRATKSGSYAVSFGIAVSEYRNGESKANFFDVTAFASSEKQRDFYSDIRKGDKIAIQGRLTQDTWEAKDGTKHSKVAIVAFEVFKMPSSRAIPTAPTFSAPAAAPSAPSDELWGEDIPF